MRHNDPPIALAALTPPFSSSFLSLLLFFYFSVSASTSTYFPSLKFSLSLSLSFNVSPLPSSSPSPLRYVGVSRDAGTVRATACGRETGDLTLRLPQRPFLSESPRARCSLALSFFLRVVNIWEVIECLDLRLCHCLFVCLSPCVYIYYVIIYIYFLQLPPFSRIQLHLSLQTQSLSLTSPPPTPSPSISQYRDRHNDK